MMVRISCRQQLDSCSVLNYLNTPLSWPNLGDLYETWEIRTVLDAVRRASLQYALLSWNHS